MKGEIPMKKMLSLVLVLALCLTAVTAFAAAPSKMVGIINVFVNGAKCNEVPTAEALAASNVEMLKVVQQGPANYFKTDVNDVFEFSPVKVIVPGDAVVDGKVEATFSADTKFDANENVQVLLSAEGENGLAWTSYQGVANAEGDVVATVDVKVLEEAAFAALCK